MATGATAIKLWAPLARKAALIRNETETIPLALKEGGYWEAQSPTLKAGDRYRFSIDDKDPLPDPASLFQPEGVHGPSEVVDLGAWTWSDEKWQNPPLSEYLLYELHTGTFSSEGTFAGIEARLDHLVNLGVNAIEIMPVAQFPGSRNWGYDGVYPFAVQNSYGGARGLQQLVDACHRKGLAVVLDVVYNHLGPEGAYLGAYGPYFTEKYKTPWGPAVNFDDAYCDGVRDYFVQNALMWFRDFHIDALRLDAVHAIKDFSAVHILREIHEAVKGWEAVSGKRHYLIVELDLNDPRFIDPVVKGGYGMDAQWVDEFHHALRVTAGGDRSGYYEDFSGLEHLAKTYQDAYVYDGQYSPHRKKTFGLKATHHPGERFIVFSQNHDQVGNRMLGERTSTLVSFEMQKLLAAAVFVSPYLPMLFMGEEWGEPHPFLYFVSHTDPELAAAVRKGRREEFAAFHAQGEAPDPVAEETFRASLLQWELQEQEPHRTLLEYYRALVRLRKTHPLLRSTDRSGVEATPFPGEQTLLLHRSHGADHLYCFMNFSKEAQVLSSPAGAGPLHKILDSADTRWGGPGGAPGLLKEGEPLTIPPEAALVYATQLFSLHEDQP